MNNNNNSNNHLSAAQKTVIERLHTVGLHMIAYETETAWNRGSTYYIDNRAPVSRNLRQQFNKANREAFQR